MAYQQKHLENQCIKVRSFKYETLYELQLSVRFLLCTRHNFVNVFNNNSNVTKQKCMVTAYQVILIIN